MPQFPDVLTLIGALAGPLATAEASSGLQLEDAPATAPVIPAATLVDLGLTSDTGA
jgi:hypothetical protein